MHRDEGAQLADGGAELGQGIHQLESYFVRNLLIYE
jgi:hypothetical protein